MWKQGCFLKAWQTALFSHESQMTRFTVIPFHSYTRGLVLIFSKNVRYYNSFKDKIIYDCRSPLHGFDRMKASTPVSKGVGSGVVIVRWNVSDEHTID
jgi:hypothetical protein